MEMPLGLWGFGALIRDAVGLSFENLKNRLDKRRRHGSPERVLDEREAQGVSLATIHLPSALHEA